MEFNELIGFLKAHWFRRIYLMLLANRFGALFTTKKVKADIKRAQKENDELDTWTDEYIKDCEWIADQDIAF